MAQNLWTTEHTTIARKMLRDNASEREFVSVLGRTKYAAQDRIRYLDKPRYRDRVKARAKAAKALEAADPMPTMLSVERPRSIPPEVIEDAFNRASAMRSITAFVFGDPAPGFSALDKKQGAFA